MEIWRTLALQANSNNVPFVSVINPLFITMEIKIERYSAAVSTAALLFENQEATLCGRWVAG